MLLKTGGPRVQRLGYSLIEMLVALAIAMVGLAAGLPAMQSALAGQRLDSSINRLSMFVQSARQIAIASGCGTSLSVARRNNSIHLSLSLLPANAGSGCGRWFEANRLTGSGAALLREDTLDRVIVNRDLTILFRGSSGRLDHTAPQSATMSWNEHARNVTVEMLGTLEYRHAI